LERTQLRLRLPTPGLRTQVLLLALALLAIPWVGYRYILEMERFLRAGQERALTATARAVATALHDRSTLFEAGGAAPLAASDGGLYVRALPASIVLDGSDADWARLNDASPDAPVTYSGATLSMTPRLGKRDRFLYLLVKVADEHVVYRAIRDPAPDRSDRLEIGLVNPRGAFQRFVVAPYAPGPVSASIVTATKSTAPEPRIDAVWREVPGGYVVEARMPLNMIGPRLGLISASVDDTVSRETTAMAGPTGIDKPEVLAAVVVPESEIDLILQGLGRTRSRIWVVDREHKVLAQTGTLKPPSDPLAPLEEQTSFASELGRRIEQATLRRVYAQVLQRPTDDFDEGPMDGSEVLRAEIDGALRGTTVTRWRMTPDRRAVVLAAAHPIFVGDRAAGAVVVEETTNAILSVRTRALETLFTTALVVLLLGSVALFAFATRLSTRIRRLRDEAEQAVDQHGRIRGIIASSTAGDEIGDVSRSFSTVLRRLSEYNAYLENMGGRLAHEIRTPIAVVRSSLENLRLHALPQEAKVYMERAHEGLERLSRILTSMTEATRLEQLLQHAERERFDLRAVVAGCVNGYRLAYPHLEFQLDAPAEPVPLEGAPDLIAQMLDKLAANAADFASPATPVRIQLASEHDAAHLRVQNIGPLLPDSMQGRLFESMVSIRPHRAGDGGPHLGMGLYIARLIAEFHGGEVSAENRADRTGVIVGVDLPLAPA
jgi:dedicated sortase system histidine kinase